MNKDRILRRNKKAKDMKQLAQALLNPTQMA